MMAIERASVADKLHYSGPSGGGGGYQHPGYGGGSGGGAHVYSSIGHSGYGYGGDPHHSHHYSSSGGGGKKSIALSALTLLAFLFFLHILQTCLQDQQNSTTTTQVVVMAARAEGKVELTRLRKGDVEDLDEEYTEKRGFKANDKEDKGKGREKDHN